jgi:hypothetical protein
MDVLDEENGTVVPGSCEEVYYSRKSSSSESRSDDNHMSLFLL